MFHMTYLSILRVLVFCLACRNSIRAAESFCGDGCAVDLDAPPLPSGYVQNGAVTTCNYACPSGSGSIGRVCTTTTAMPITTTAAPVLSGRCASIVKNGTLYMNKCVIIDRNATCNPDESSPVTCGCSIGYSGTTCSVADAQLLALEELLGGKDEAQQVLQAIADSKGKGGSATLISNLPSLLSFLTDEKREGMSYEVGEVIVAATYEGKKLDLNTAFSRVTDPSLGNCCTFNHFNATTKYAIRRVGEAGGLRVELDSMPDEYAPWTDVVGMNVYVHPMGQELNVESNKYSSIAGSSDQISTFHKVGKKCARSTAAAQSFYLQGHYTLDGCLRACYQDSVQRSCGCMDSSYARKAGVGGCKFGNLSCISSMVARRGDPVHWKECNCPPPCDEETYDYVVSRASQIRVDSLHLRSRRSEVMVFFGTFQTTVNTEVYRMSLSQVVGAIGGIAGLLLGITVSFVIEVALLAFQLLTILLRSKSPNSP